MVDQPKSKLRVITAPPELKGQEFELAAGEAIIGRDPSADITIPEKVVSRRHARLSLKAGVYYLEDLGSSNGTFLDGKQVQGVMALHDGDQIQLGMELTLVFEAPAPEPAPTRLSQATMAEVQRTLLEEERQGPPPAAAPELLVKISGAGTQTYRLTRPQVSIGRSEDNDIVIPSQIVSRHHIRLERSGEGYVLVMLPEATNRLLYRGRPIAERHTLRHGDEIQVESAIAGMAVSIVYQASEEAAQTVAAPGAATPVYVPIQPTDKTMLDASFPTWRRAWPRK